MIAKLRGLIDSLGDDWAVVDCGGVGYLVSCSSRSLARLEAGTAATLFVETHVREDAIALYGFLEAGERDWFRLLTTVQGVGAKVALSILSVAAPEQLLQIIAAGDKTGLTRANGVGPKLATRILSELKDKVGGLALGPAATTAGPTGTGLPPAAATPEAAAVGDAVSALVNLGYGRSEAFAAALAAVKALGPTATLSALIRHSLQALGRRDTER